MLKYLFVITMLLGQLVFAAGEDDSLVLLEPKEKELHERAKKRLYPGGRDEEPLKPMAQLPNVQRKSSAAEPEEESTDSADAQD